MILMVAPGPDMSFGAMPSGAAYVSDSYALVKIANDSAADQAALTSIGCQTLTPFGGWGNFGFQTLAELYAADTGAILPGRTGYPQYTVASIFADPTATNVGTWYKTGTGNGAGNWTQAAPFIINGVAQASQAAINAADSATAAQASEAAAAADAGDAYTYMSAVQQFAGISKVYATHAAMVADVANIAANAFVEVLVDETDASLRTTIYQKQSGSMVLIRAMTFQNAPYYFPAGTDTAVRAALTAATAAGQGTICLPDAFITLSSPLPASNYIHWVGIQPRMTFSADPDDDWTYTGGTVLQGDGTFPCFSGNTTPNPTSPTNVPTFTNGGIKGFALDMMGIQNFSNGIAIGAHNVMGLVYGSLSNLWIRHCSSWAVDLCNTMHTDINRVWVSQALGDGPGWHDYNDIDGDFLLAGNRSAKDVFISQVNPLQAGALIHATSGAGMNDVRYQRLQINRYGTQLGLNAALTMTNGSTAIGVADLSQYAVGLPLILSASVNGFVAGKTYIVLSKSAATGAGSITLGTSYRDGAIQATGSSAVNGASNGCFCLEIRWDYDVSGTAAIENCRFLQLDLSGNESMGKLYLEGVDACVIDVAETDDLSGGGNAITGRYLSNCKVIDWEGGLHDFDNSCISSIFEGLSRGMVDIWPRGNYWDETYGRAGLTLNSFNATAPDFVACNPGGVGFMTRVNRPLTRLSRGALAGTVAMDAGYAAGGIIPVHFGAGSALTLPTITNTNPDVSIVGVEFVIVAEEGATTLSTDGTQVFNDRTGFTMAYIPQGSWVSVVGAESETAGQFTYLVMGGPDFNSIVGSAGFTLGALASGASVTETITVTGAAIGDEVGRPWLSVSQAGLVTDAYVSAANTVTVVIANLTGASVTLGSCTINVRVKKAS